MSRKEALSQFINQIHGRPVVVKLNSGVDYRGVLACLDGYMNIALDQTEEYVNGQLKNKYGDAFIRGNNVLYISTQKRRVFITAIELLKLLGTNPDPCNIFSDQRFYDGLFDTILERISKQKASSYTRYTSVSRE